MWFTDAFIQAALNALSFFATFKLLDNLKNGCNMICTSWNSFGGKSILSQARDTKFGGKLKTHGYINWWKFGVDISNHFWVIQNQPKFIVHCRQPFGHFRHPEVQNDRLVVYSEQWILVDSELPKSGLRYQHKILTS